MPTSIQYPLINGVRHSFASIEFKLWTPSGAGQIYVGFKSINYSRKRTRSQPRGAHPDPLGKTRGDNDYAADCELYLAEWNLFQATLGKGYGDIAGQVIVTYGENQFDVITDTLNGCNIDSTEASQSQGPDALVRKVDLGPTKILFNGLDDLAVPLAAPPST